MGRKPFGERALTSAERQRRYLERIASQTVITKQSGEEIAELKKQIAALEAEVARLAALNRKPRPSLNPELRTATAAPAADASIPRVSTQEKYAALEIRLRAKLEKEFDDKVMYAVEKHINEYVLPHYKEKLERAEAILRVGLPFTNAEYRFLLARTHPDMGGDSDVFKLLKSKESVLRSEEKERPLSSALPKSLEEMRAMKAQKDAEKKAARAATSAGNR